MAGAIPIPASRSFQDLTGKRFGRLVVICLSHRDSHGSHWRCRCDCGKEPVVRGYRLGKKTNSCGCLQRERARETARLMATRHGQYRTPEYRAWCHMIRRCYSTKASHYQCYGGRGIKVCRRWRASFQNFLADMGRRPSPKHSLDRRDNNGDYTARNCRWATQTEQLLNTRQNRLVQFEGRTQPLAAWARERGISPRTLRSRLNKGWAVRRALNESIQPQTRHVGR